MTWAALDDAARFATGGWPLRALVPGIRDLSGVAVRLLIVSHEGSDYLRVEAPGVGALEGFPLVDVGHERWLFFHQRDGLDLQGMVERTSDGLTVRLVSGLAVWGDITLNLSPATLQAETP